MTKTAGKIFICYRRADSRADAGRLYDRLNSRYPNRVFRDIASLAPGADWEQTIDTVLGSSAACVVVIGPHWLDPGSSGERRLDDKHDIVRAEVATALERNVAVLPVLVGGAQMPSEDVLPAALKGLARRHAIAITEQDFDEGVSKLANAIDITLGGPTSGRGWIRRASIAAAAVLAIAAIAVFWMRPELTLQTSKPPVENKPTAVTTKPRPAESTEKPVESTQKPPVRVSPERKPAASTAATGSPAVRVADFVNAGVAQSASRAVLIVDEQHRPDIPTTERMAASIGAENSLFKDAFVREGLFARAQRGDVDVLRPLGLDRLEMIALGVKSTNTAPDVAETQLIRATVSIVLRVIRPASGFAATTVSVQGTGAGFDAARATEDGAEKALAKLIAQLKSS